MKQAIRSRVKSIAGRSSLDETLPIGAGDLLYPAEHGVFAERPLSLMENQNKIVPHDEIPTKVMAAIVTEYGEEYFLGKTWTLDTVRRLDRVLSRPRENLTNTLAMVCTGTDRCPFQDTCFYKTAGRIPIGDRCPIEIDRSMYLYDGYIIAISERLGVGPDDLRNDTIYSNMVWELVECDMVKARVLSKMGNDGELGETVAAIWQETGHAYTEEVESPLTRIAERYSARKEKILRSLIATPEMAARFMKKKANQDLHDKQVSLISELEAIIFKSKSVDGIIVDADVVSGPKESAKVDLDQDIVDVGEIESSINMTDSGKNGE